MSHITVVSYEFAVICCGVELLLAVVAACSLRQLGVVAPLVALEHIRVSVLVHRPLLLGLLLLLVAGKCGSIVLDVTLLLLLLDLLLDCVDGLLADGEIARLLLHWLRLASHHVDDHIGLAARHVLLAALGGASLVALKELVVSTNGAAIDHVVGLEVVALVEARHADLQVGIVAASKFVLRRRGRRGRRRRGEQVSRRGERAALAAAADELLPATERQATTAPPAAAAAAELAAPGECARAAAEDAEQDEQAEEEEGQDGADDDGRYGQVGQRRGVGERRGRGAAVVRHVDDEHDAADVGQRAALGLLLLERVERLARVDTALLDTVRAYLQHARLVGGGGESGGREVVGELVGAVRRDDAAEHALVECPPQVRARHAEHRAVERDDGASHHVQRYVRTWR